MIKHTGEMVEYDGTYELCIEAVSIASSNLLINMHIGEKLNPALYHNEMSQLPLVESQ